MAKQQTKVSLNELEVGTSEFAELVGKTPQWIRQLTRDEILVQCGRGKYKLGENLAAYMEYSSGGKAGDEKLTHADIKAEHEVLKKEKTELQLQQMRGQLHSSEDVRLLMGDMILSAKSNLLSLPTRVSPTIVDKSATKIEQILSEEISATLTVLMDYSPNMFTEYESEESSE